MSNTYRRQKLLRRLRRLRSDYELLDKERFNATNLRQKHNIILLMETTIQEMSDILDELIKTTDIIAKSQTKSETDVIEITDQVEDYRELDDMRDLNEKE